MHIHISDSHRHIVISPPDPLGRRSRSISSHVLKSQKSQVVTRGHVQAVFLQVLQVLPMVRWLPVDGTFAVPLPLPVVALVGEIPSRPSPIVTYQAVVATRTLRRARAVHAQAWFIPVYHPVGRIAVPPGVPVPPDAHVCVLLPAAGVVAVRFLRTQVVVAAFARICAS